MARCRFGPPTRHRPVPYVINAVIVPTRTPREAAERWAKRRGGEQEPHGHRGGLVDGDQRAGVAAAVAPSATSRYVPTTDHVSSVVRRGRFIPLVRVRTCVVSAEHIFEVPSCPVRVRHTIMAIDHAQADLCGCVRPTACVDRNGAVSRHDQAGRYRPRRSNSGPAR